jgi:hypothetical protein
MNIAQELQAYAQYQLGHLLSRSPSFQGIQERDKPSMPHLRNEMLCSQHLKRLVGEIDKNACDALTRQIRAVHRMAQLPYTATADEHYSVLITAQALQVDVPTVYKLIVQGQLHVLYRAVNGLTDVRITGQSIQNFMHQQR